MHKVSYEFLIKPKESAECHQTLSFWVGSWNETNSRWQLIKELCNIPDVKQTLIIVDVVVCYMVGLQ